MKRSAFASLCGVSKQMVSKYEEQGFVIVADGLVDVQASLAALEGRLDEAKRRTALQVMAASATAQSAAPTVRAPLAPQASSAKAQKDEIELRLRELEYGVKVGELVYAADVAEQAQLAISAMREAFANGKRDIAANLCAQFDIPGEKVTAIARFLGEQFELPLGRFALIASGLAKEAPADADTAFEPSTLEKQPSDQAAA